MPKTYLFATLASAPPACAKDFASLSSTIYGLEVRADLTGNFDPHWLRERFQGRLLYALRSHSSGGLNAETGAVRRERLLAASRGYDLVELEANHDLTPFVLERIPVSKRLLSWYGSSSSLSELHSTFRRLSAVPARFYKLVLSSRGVKDELTPLLLLRALGRTDTVAYATGPTGSWSRLLAPLLGAPAVFGLLAEDLPPVGEFTVKQLLSDYHITALPSVAEVYGIVGDAVRHSLSPCIHNAAYRTLGRPALYLPFAGASFWDYWRELVQARGLEALGVALQGLTVASPHKETVLALCAASSQAARRAGSANVSFPAAQGWIADTTDPKGVLAPLHRRGVPLLSRRVAVVGCGGAGRGVAAALARTGAAVTLVNRGLHRGLHAASLLGLPFVPLNAFRPAGYAIVVNATSLGREPGEIPFAPEQLDRDAVLVDLVYGRQPTDLAARARERGLVTVDGCEVLLEQFSRQFRLLTGQPLPASILRAAACRAGIPNEISRDSPLVCGPAARRFPQA
jgi:3-dehydroquinate dehydratase/shikimate dehydrogenase